jgi:hypothetical protein
MPSEKPVREEKEYAILDEGNEMVAQLQKRYEKILWAVIPEQVVVLGVTNKERPKTMRKLATITRINAAHRAIIKHLRGKVKFFIALYCSDWVAWSNPRRQWILLHELLHIPEQDEMSGLIKHDVEDWGLLIDAAGIDWFNKESLPDLLVGEMYPFKESLALRLHLHNDEEQNGNRPGDAEID